LTVVLRSLRLVLVFALVAAFLASCGSGGKKAAPATANGTVKTSNKEADLKLGNLDVESFGPDVKISKADQQAVLSASQKYVDTAIVSPLTNGSVGASYAPLFTAGLRARATGADQATLTDESIGKVKQFSQTASPVAVSALVDGAGAFTYLAANFLVNVKATAAVGPMTLTRNVELTFAPNGKAWDVNAYRVTTVRKLPTGTSTTVASSGVTSK
jgi:hypothetical protein